MKKSKLFLSSAIVSAFLGLASPVAAQDVLQVAPIGRVHLDGAVYLPSGKSFNDGMSISEVRAGAIARYQDWLARIEVGYSYGKIGMKDVYMQKNINQSNSMRFGYFIPQFGIRGGGSSSLKPSMIPQVSESFFRTMTRKIGAAYTYNDNDAYVSGSAFVGGRSMTLNSTEQGKVSVGGAVRSVWHPVIENGDVAHLGVTAFYETASHTQAKDESGEEVVSPGFRTYSASFPTNVASVPMLSAPIKDAVGDWKFEGEAVLATGCFALETQGTYMIVPRHSAAAYKAMGGFGSLRVLLVGDDEYSYSKSDASLATPSAGTLELVASADVTDAGTKENAVMNGGLSRDYSLTLNYYINRYMAARLRWSLTDVKESPVAPRDMINIVQARLQFVF